MAVSTLLRAKPANVITIPENEDLGQAARLLMKHNIGGLPVVSSSGSPVGFLSERDIVRAMEKHPRGLRGVAVPARGVVQLDLARTVPRREELGSADPRNHVVVHRHPPPLGDPVHDPQGGVVQGRVTPHQERRSAAPLGQHPLERGHPRLVPVGHRGGVVRGVVPVALGVLQGQRLMDATMSSASALLVMAGLVSAAPRLAPPSTLLSEGHCEGAPAREFRPHEGPPATFDGGCVGVRSYRDCR
jgi:CBS domain-containing protein